MIDVKDMTVAEKKDWIKFKLKVVESLTQTLNEAQQQLLLDSIIADMFGWEIVNGIKSLETPNQINTSEVEDVVNKFNNSVEDIIPPEMEKQIDELYESVNALNNQVSAVSEQMEVVENIENIETTEVKG